MQEVTNAAPLRVWPFALASSATAILIGILAIPIHLVKALAHHGGMREVEYGGGVMMRPPMVPGSPPPGMPNLPSMPREMMPGPEYHAVWQSHPGLGIAWVIIGLIVFAVYAGIAGAVFAAVYNALIARRPAAS